MAPTLASSRALAIHASGSGVPPCEVAASSATPSPAPIRTLRPVIWLVGIPVRPEDARHLVTTLLADSSPNAIDTARTLTHALDAHAISVALTKDQRSAILAALEDPPAGLGELRSVLVRHRFARREASFD